MVRGLARGLKSWVYSGKEALHVFQWLKNFLKKFLYGLRIKILFRRIEMNQGIYKGEISLQIVKAIPIFQLFVSILSISFLCQRIVEKKHSMCSNG